MCCTFYGVVSWFRKYMKSKAVTGKFTSPDRVVQGFNIFTGSRRNHSNGGRVSLSRIGSQGAAFCFCLSDFPSYPFSETYFQDISRVHIDFSGTIEYTLTLSLPISQCELSLLSGIHFINFYLSLTYFENFPGLLAFLQDFPVLENSKTFQVFQDPYEPSTTYYFNTLITQKVGIG